MERLQAGRIPDVTQALRVQFAGEALTRRMRALFDGVDTRKAAHLSQGQRQKRTHFATKLALEALIGDDQEHDTDDQKQKRPQKANGECRAN